MANIILKDIIKNSIARSLKENNTENVTISYEDYEWDEFNKDWVRKEIRVTGKYKGLGVRHCSDGQDKITIKLEIDGKTKNYNIDLSAKFSF